MKRLVRCMLITYCAFAAPGVHQAQTNITIREIGGRKVDAKKIEVGPFESLAGTLSSEGKDGPIAIQVARRRTSEAAWRVLPEVQWLQPGTKKRQWQLSGLALGSALGDAAPLEGCGLRFELIALAAGRPLPAGPLDPGTLQTAAAVSTPLEVRRRDCEAPSPGSPAPRIRIDYVADRPVPREGFREVRLQETVRGSVIKPEEAVVRVVVQPVDSTDRWVMLQDPQIAGRRWTGSAQFGREGLDEWVDFLVYAVVTDPRLPVGRGLSPAEWNSYARQLVLATSVDILVRRIEIPRPRGSSRVTLEIHAIGDTSIDDRQVWPVDRKSGIVGLLKGRSLSRSENVWLLATSRFEGSEWRVVGKASSLANGYWEMPPRILGETGEFLDLIAVLSEQRVETLSDEEIRESMHFSRRVHVVIRDRPPLEVIFTAIDGRGITGQRNPEAPSLSSLQGTVAGRPREKGEEILIFEADATVKGGWKLIGPALFVNKHLWAMPPKSLGRGDERIVLLAVVATERIERLTPETYPKIVAFSDKLELRLRAHREGR